MKATDTCGCLVAAQIAYSPRCAHCGRRFATDAGAHGQPNPPSADAPPVSTAGAEGVRPRPALADLSPWETDPADDYVPTWSAPEGERIAAIFNAGHRP
jgi:hypothetical protein